MGTEVRRRNDHEKGTFISEAFYCLCPQSESDADVYVSCDFPHPLLLWGVVLSILCVALQATPVTAAFLIEYQAPADPTTVGFSELVNVPPEPQVKKPIANDLGYPAWSISGLELRAQFVYLSGALNAAQKADINSQGFTLTLRGRVLRGNAPAYDAGYNTIIGGAALAIEGQQYALGLGINSSGNTVAVLVTSSCAVEPGGSVLAYGPNYTLNDSGYHT